MVRGLARGFRRRQRYRGDDQWTCGHVSDAVCGECYRLLAARAHELAEEVDRLRDELDEQRR